MSFQAKMGDAKLLKDMVTAISTLIEEATFDMAPGGIKLRAMDPSRVAMVDFEWPKNVFDEYNCREPMKVCININGMLKLLRRVGREESVELSFQTKTGRLQMTIMGKYMRTFNISTFEAMEEEVPTPKVTFNVKVKATAENFRQAIEDANLVSDHVRIEVNNEKMVMRATGDLMTTVIELNRGSDAVFDIEVKEPSKATYSLSYLYDILKAAVATSEIAVISFSTDMPIRLDFPQQKEGKLTFYLAPRIEVE